jgi:hypothetical protein
MNQPKKNGGVQLSCNDTFAKAISVILPQKKNLSSQCLFRDWIPEAKDEPSWLTKIDEYFNSCKTTDEERESNREEETESQQAHTAPAQNKQNLRRDKSCK